MNYDPNSLDSMFSKVLQKLEAQDQILAEIKEQVTKTNGRVTDLEFWKKEVMAKVGWLASIVSFVASATLIFLERLVRN